MKVLLASFAHRTHFQGLAPLAWALVAAGHEVRVASQPALAESVAAAGLTAVPVGTDHRLFEIDPVAAAEVHRYTTDLDFARRGTELDGWDFLHGIERVNARSVFPLVNNPEFVQELVGLARDWRPDLVLWEPFTFAGAIAARACGAAHARLTWGTDLTGWFRSRFLARRAERPEGDRPDPLADWLAATGEPYGVPYTDDLAVGQWTIDQAPARFRLDSGLESVFSRNLVYNGPAVVPDWLRMHDGVPRVCVTGGFSGFGHDPDRDAKTLSALARFDAEIVVTRSAVDPASVPGNVRLVDFVPLNSLLPHCVAVVHHGGAGTWASALHHAVPQIAIAYEWDCIFRGRRTAESGAGLYSHPADIDPDGVEEAVSTVLGDPSYAAAARELRDEALAEPPPAAVVPRIEELVAQHR